MEAPAIRLDIFAILILLGVIQGLFLSFFFLNKRIRRQPSSLYLGCIMLALSLIILEIFLNHSGYMFQALRIDNFSEPLSFAAAPLMFLYIFASISGKPPRRIWLHLVPLIFWALYCIPYFVQPIELKQYHYLNYHYPDLEIQIPDIPYRADPLGLRTYVNELVMVQLTLYFAVSLIYIGRTFKSLGLPFFVSGKKPISWLRNFIFLMFAILITFIVVKFTFEADIGDYLIGSLISIVIYATSFNVIRASDFFQENVPDVIGQKKKYEKSALNEEDKARILDELKQCMEKDRDFLNPLVSQPYIAKKLNRPVHHISQVINEKLHQSFFEMIATYRIDEAKRILRDSEQVRITIEDLADEVGYNSKSAFNRSFKKHTGLTPSEFRDKV